MKTNTPAEFDAYDRTYNETVDRAIAFSGLKVDFFTRVKVEYLVEVLESCGLSGKCAEVVDVGCGVANSHTLLADRVGRLAGVDISQACLVKAATQNPKNEYKLFDGVNLPYEDGRFDAASAVCVFHHIPIRERVRLARDVRRVLRPGGVFVIFEHNPLNPLTKYVVNNCEFDNGAVLLSRKETEMVLKEAGFIQIYSRFILAVPAKGRILRRIDLLFAKMPIGAQYFTVGRA